MGYKKCIKLLAINLFMGWYYNKEGSLKWNTCKGTLQRSLMEKRKWMKIAKNLNINKIKIKGILKPI